MNKLLEIKDLKTYFHTDDGTIKAVDGVNLHIEQGKTLGIVGESGSGKSITSFSVLQLISTPGEIVSGEILYKGQDLLKLTEKQIRKVRGNDIAMIFQEPMTSLNPVYTIGEQISESIREHKGLTKKQAYNEAIKMLKIVGIPSAEQRIHNYPHQLSGGMRQRVMIAIALCCEPDLLIADEPTTALDVTTQAQILELLKDLKERLGTSILLITHDLGIVAEAADDVAVMYAGKVVENADVISFFKTPLHPYSQGLLKSIPSLDDSKEELEPIRGSVPNPLLELKGCHFCPRCDMAQDICMEEEPELISYEGRKVKCWMYTEEWKGQKEDEFDGK